MTTTKAAELVGCGVSHLRLLIRSGRIAARPVPIRDGDLGNNQGGYRWEVDPESVTEYLRRRRIGRPRKPKE